MFMPWIGPKLEVRHVLSPKRQFLIFHEQQRYYFSFHNLLLESLIEQKLFELEGNLCLDVCRSVSESDSKPSNDKSLVEIKFQLNRFSVRSDQTVIGFIEDIIRSGRPIIVVSDQIIAQTVFRSNRDKHFDFRVENRIRFPTESFESLSFG